MTLHVRPLTLKQANELVARWHRHHKPVTGHRFSLGLYDEAGRPHGAAIIGRPVARAVGQYAVAEVTRLVTDGTRNGCSALYGAAARAAKGMGFQRIQTYILAEEPGTSLKASGWTCEGTVRGKPWGSGTRQRADAHPLGDKQRWSKRLNPAWPEATDPGGPPLILVSEPQAYSGSDRVRVPGLLGGSDVLLGVGVELVEVRV